jgi:hypothetical protein
LAVKRTLAIAGVCAVFLLIAVIALAALFAPSSGARRAWKEKALADISSRLTDPLWASNEVARLNRRAPSDSSNSDRWLSERLILMRNGDWLAYGSVCQKENRRIADLFLARGSDGRWYYSTFHFCIGMLDLKMEDQSEDLPVFAKAYYLRSFDGHSDECLQKTWPPDSR